MAFGLGLTFGVAENQVQTYSHDYGGYMVDPYNEEQYDYTAQYADTVIHDVTYTNIFGLHITIHIPKYGEMGYFTNQFIYYNENNGEPQSTPNGDYYYFDLVDSYHGFITEYDADHSWGTTTHTDELPQLPNGDPMLTLLAYDESNYCYDYGIPLEIYGNWVSSGDVIAMPSCALLFEAPEGDSPGSFDCFYDGTNWYGNQAVITLSGDTTVTAYYHYIPSVYLSIDNVDNYSNDLGSWGGYVPIGWYVIGGYGPIWDDYMGCYVVPEGQAYWLQVVSDTYVTVYWGMA